MRAGRNRDGTGRVSGGAKNRRIKVVILVSMRIKKKMAASAICCLLLGASRARRSLTLRQSEKKNKKRTFSIEKMLLHCWFMFLHSEEGHEGRERQVVDGDQQRLRGRGRPQGRQGREREGYQPTYS